MLLTVVIPAALLYAASGAVLTDSKKFKFEEYVTKTRISILSMELATNCPHLFQEKEFVGKREIIGSDKQVIQLNIEKKLVNHLIKMLQECQSDKTAIPVGSLPAECTSPATLNLTEPWRNNYTGRSRNSDNRILLPNKTWFRFKGDAGTQLRNTCPHAQECGSSGAYWSSDSMPHVIGETITITLYESYRSKSTPPTDPVCRNNAYIYAFATRCSATGDFVYMLKEPFNSDSDTVCGMA